MATFYLLIIGLCFGFSLIFICIGIGINYCSYNDFEIEIEIEDAVINEILTRNETKPLTRT